MEVEKQIRGYKNNMFSFRVTHKIDVTSFEGGYAITPDGEFITVKRGESHKVVYEKYLNAYLGKERDKIVSQFLGVSEDSEELETLDFYTVYGLMISLGHVLYSGLGTSDDFKHVNLIVPRNYEEGLTLEQKDACVHLLLSNRIEEMDEVKVCIWDSEIELSTDEFLDKLKSTKVK